MPATAPRCVTHTRFWSALDAGTPAADRRAAAGAREGAEATARFLPRVPPGSPSNCSLCLPGLSSIYPISTIHLILLGSDHNFHHKCLGIGPMPGRRACCGGACGANGARGPSGRRVAGSATPGQIARIIPPCHSRRSPSNPACSMGETSARSHAHSKWCLPSALPPGTECDLRFSSCSP